MAWPAHPPKKRSALRPASFDYDELGIRESFRVLTAESARLAAFSFDLLCVSALKKALSQKSSCAISPGDVESVMPAQSRLEVGSSALASFWMIPTIQIWASAPRHIVPEWDSCRPPYLGVLAAKARYPSAGSGRESRAIVWLLKIDHGREDFVSCHCEQSEAISPQARRLPLRP